jgi:hypothetical protein
MAASAREDRIRERGPRSPHRLPRLLAPIFLLTTAMATIGLSGPAGADTVLFSSGTVGTSGSTATFNQSGDWTMTWNYDCSNTGSAGNFIVDITGSSGDVGPNELNTAGSGTDYYYDAGTFDLEINSECNWSIAVAPASGAPTGTPVTLTSSQTGDTGEPQAFSVGGPWTLAWSYNCAYFGSPGNFTVEVNQPAGDLNLDIGPNELGAGGNGVDSYSDTGTLSLTIISECEWSITISISGTTTRSCSLHWLHRHRICSRRRWLLDRR